MQSITLLICKNAEFTYVRKMSTQTSCLVLYLSLHFEARTFLLHSTSWSLFVAHHSCQYEARAIDTLEMVLFTYVKKPTIKYCKFGELLTA